MNLKASLDDLVKNTKTTSTYHAKFFGFKGTAPNEQDMPEYARKCLGKAIPTPEALKFKTRSYASVPNRPAGWKNVDKWWKAYHERQFDWSFPYSIEYMETQFRILRDSIGAVKAVYDFYKQGDKDPRLDGNLVKLQTVHDTI